MHFSTISPITLALLPLLNVHAIPFRDGNLAIRAVDAASAGDAASQLAAMLSNPNACGSSSSSECVKPADAIGPILNGLYKFNVNTAAEQAAVVSLMAFESVDFQFNHNVSPGRPGQGTRAMLMPNFIAKYVDDSPELASGKAAAGGDVTKLLALVQDNAHSFAAASWFYSTQCSSQVKTQVQSGGRAGWENYLTSCVGVTATQDRVAYWTRACQQLGVPSS